MEWVETTGRTIEEAKEAALDELGVDDIEAEFEIVEEPKAGLFGRVRKEARVRARIKPTKPRAKADRRSRSRTKSKQDSESSSKDERSVTDTSGTASAGSGKQDGATGQSNKSSGTKKQGSRRSGRGGRSERTDAPIGDKVSTTSGVTAEGQAEIVSDFVKGLLEAVNLEGEVGYERVADGVYEVGVTGDDLGILIGPRGQTLNAIQDLGRTVVQRRVQGGIEGRVHLDIGEYRKKRREALERFTISVASEVSASGEAKALEPMNPADRKVVHDTVNEIDGVTTRSEGEDERRHVVIVPVD